MNKIQKGYNRAKQFAKDNAPAVVGAAVTGAMFLANFAHADGTFTADPTIATTADQVGGQFQVNILSALTTILPYVLAVVGIFLAVKLGMRWMKKSAR